MSLDRLRERQFQITFVSHAEAILNADFPEALKEIDDTFGDFAIPIEVLIRGGGGETETTQALRRTLNLKGWPGHIFEVKKLVDGVEREAISHAVDHVRTLAKGKVALEIEWNNKDPFFDRDLENFKRLHAEGAISAGVIVTRGAGLQSALPSLIRRFATEAGLAQHDDLVRFDLERTSRQKELVDRRMRAAGATFADAWADVFCSDKFGQATTHWRKLDDRVRRGVGNPCPLLLIGIPEQVVIF